MAAKEPVLQEFECTPIPELNKSVNKLRSTFRMNKTKDVQYRLVQLRKLYWSIKDNEALLHAALKQDLRKCAMECHLSETGMAMNEIMFMINNLERFTKDSPVEDVPFQFKLTNPRIRREPLGLALIIGAYNFPVQLSIGPLVGAIAAGCTAVLKPSESAPATAMALKYIIEKYLDADAFSVVNGAVAETTALLDQKWDKIFYTGGLAVGKIIAKKAAETLTPVTLELGGLNPAFVTKNADIKLAARRLLWGKVVNAGQVCLSQNYILIDKDVLDPFIAALKESYKDFFPAGAKSSPDYSRIVNARHFARMKKMLDETDGKIILGGELDEADLFIEPTAVLVESTLDSMMRDESFGPIFSIMAYDTLDEAINTANSVCRCPLGLYTFGTDEENQKGELGLFFTYYLADV
jgi:beta-apo-4'-carotenal oxygenase